MKIKPEIVKARIARARTSLNDGVAYKLGKGGFFPNSPTPATIYNNELYCDCSGFVAWVLEISRKPKASRPYWIETTAIYKDATGKQTAFVRLDKPEPGCIVVYPDRKVMGVGKQGHTGVVTQVWPDGKIQGIDCSSGMYKKTGDAIHERDLSFFLANKQTIFCCLRQDMA